MWINPFQSTVKPEPVLRDVWDRPEGPFRALYEFRRSGARVEMPWDSDDNVSAQDLDLAYIHNHSGSKFCSPLIKQLIRNNETPVLTEQQASNIAAMLISKYLRNWQRLWETMVAEYNPIHNYNMSETRDLATTEDNVKTTDGTLAKTGTDTMAYGKGETTTHGRATDEQDYLYGFNAGVGEYRPTDRYNTQESGTTGVAETGADTQTKNLTDKNDEEVTEDNEGTEHETIVRSGNIGVTTTQRMIEEERRIWLWNYFDQIFADLDRELTLPIFDPCRV